MYKVISHSQIGGFAEGVMGQSARLFGTKREAMKYATNLVVCRVDVHPTVWKDTGRYPYGNKLVKEF